MPFISSVRGTFGAQKLNIGKLPLGTSPLFPAISASEILLDNPSAPSGFYYIKFSASSNVQRIYCDMSDGGWMLVAQRLNSTSNSMDVRKTGFFTEYPADSFLINGDWTNLNTEGYVNFWPYLNGSRRLKFLYGVTGITTSNPGSGTVVLSVQENSNNFANLNYWGYSWSPSSVTCPPSSHRYDWSTISVNTSLWNNTHQTGMNQCSGFGWQSTNYIGNFYANLDCGSCYSPRPVLFGGGGTGYYSYGNHYDAENIQYNLAFTTNFNGLSTATTYTNNNQLWLK